ncbi:hypothetical protein CHS0354_024840 [Potamilus streckersoni]|uniref:Ig-like domain-containing protein n=1 Tax=Potamilus streckersoni TaxID=2493646 RepID=A0AAE0T0Q2_9BIVA|nr:hypothetical protein CHS0354_024840 [Potamilus streckersoni]
MEASIFDGANITEFFAKDHLYEIMENSTLELHCRVDSNPYPEISLFLGDVLQYATRDLSELIYTATAGCLNGGKYICSATNSFMNRARVTAEVDVKVRCK